MKISNPTNWPYAHKYEKEYSSKLEELFPEIKNIEIEINSCEEDIYSPLFCKCKKNDATLLKDTVYYDKSLCNRIKDERQMLALISHEIGHIVASYKGEDKGGNEEEIIADNYTCELGQGINLLEVLIWLRDDYKKNQKDPNWSQFSFLPNMVEQYKKNIKDYDERIKNIKEWLNTHNPNIMIRIWSKLKKCLCR